MKTFLNTPPCCPFLLTAMSYRIRPRFCSSSSDDDDDDGGGSGSGGGGGNYRI